MQSRTRFPHPTRGRPGTRVVTHLAAFAALGAVAALGFGCTEPRATGAPPKPNALLIIGGQPGVLNTQLSPIGASSWDSFGTIGHLQIKLFEDGHVEWKGMILNPQCMTFLAGGVYLPAVQDELPTREDRALIDLLASGEQTSCGDVPLKLEDSGTISPALAERLITEPESFVVAFFADGGGVIWGALQIGNPNELTR